MGSATGDDAGVYRIDRDRALVQTTDFFTPVVDDPFSYGQIAAANALSDVYAMGGRPLTALNIMGIPVDLVPAEAIREILRGGALKIKQAKCVLLGGHTIKNPEPVYGLAVTGLVSPRRILTNAGARPGDALVLTKPLGTGIVTTGIKRGLTPPALERKVIAIMARLNDAGPELAERGWVRAAVDVTGFGLLGHLHAMLRASHVGAEIDSRRVPVVGKGVLELIAAGSSPRWQPGQSSLRERVHGVGPSERRGENLSGRRANQRRLAALRAGAAIESCFDAAETPQNALRRRHRPHRARGEA